MIDWNKKRVVVTGGTGFIGSVLVEELLQRGAIVRVPMRAENYRSLSKLRAKIEWMEGDLRDHEYCTRLVMGMDALFHLASHRRHLEFHHEHCADVVTGNVEMTLALIHALKEYPHARVTVFSSANVPPEIDVIRLAALPSTDGYVLGKAIAEALWLTAARQYGFPLLIVRPVGVYGERDTFSLESNVIPSLFIKAETEKKMIVWGSGKQERVFLYVADLVSAAFRLLDVDAGGIQYVRPPDVTTVSELATMIRDLVHPNLPIDFDTTKPDGSRSIPVLEPHACLKDVPWTPLAEGLRRTYEGWRGKAVHSSQ